MTRIVPPRVLFQLLALACVAAVLQAVSPRLAHADLSPPRIEKAFADNSIAVGDTTTLTFTLSNDNAGTDLTGVNFGDTFPSGLVIATPSGLSTSCNGTLSAASGSGTVTLIGATLPAAGSCTVTMQVLATSGGLKTNRTSVITSNEVPAGNSAEATLSVVGFVGSTLNPPALNSTLPGLPVMVRFTAGGFQGYDLFAAGSPASRRIDCTTFAPLSGFEPARRFFGIFYYARLSDSYSYFWWTRAAWLGTCREFRVSLASGPSISVYFRFP